MSWKFALALGLIGTLTGCEDDACTNADSLVSACAPSDVTTPSDSSSTSETLACAGARLCHASCINLASCAEINALQCLSGAISCPPLVGDGGLSPYVSPLAQCILACSAADAGD
jgi:hypothetical protein